MERSVRVRIITPLYQSITKLSNLFSNQGKNKNQGLDHFVRQVTRPIILFRSISLEHNGGGRLNGEVKGWWANLASGPLCIHSMSRGIWVSFLELMLFSCPCFLILLFLFWMLMPFYGSLLCFFFNFLLGTLDKIRDTKQPIGLSGVSLVFVLWGQAFPIIGLQFHTSSMGLVRYPDTS